MPVPSLITDLSTVAASNSPAGSESPATADDYFRAHAAFIAQMRAVIGGTTDANIPTSFVKYDTITGAATLPVGTTGQRPGSPVVGQIRRNSTTGLFEGYGSAWTSLYSSADTRLAYGVTASSWGGAVASLDLSSASISSNTGTTAALSHNLYFDGTNWRAKSTGTSGYIQIFGDSISIQNAASVAAGVIAPLVNCLTISAASQVLASAPAGMGYGPGAGGTVTQLTSKSTTVTLNKPCGQITMHNASLGATTTVSFTVNNSLIAATDMVLVTPNWGANQGAYQAWCTSTGAGACIISVRNMTGGALSDALLLNFQILKGVTA